MQAAIPDLLRLVAIPILGWAAVQDVRTRRVPNDIWLPLVALGLLLIGWEGFQLLDRTFGFRLFLVRVGVSLGLVIPLSYAFWYLGGFGGADAKAFMVLAVLFPTYPTYQLLGGTVPIHVTDLGVFSLTILTNTVLIGLAFPLALGVRNLLQGEISWVMFLGHRVPVGELPERHGTLLQTPSGYTRSGLDLDALRMYLRWRGLDLSTLRSHPELADPATLPEDPNDPTDGAVRTDGGTGEPGTTDDSGNAGNFGNGGENGPTGTTGKRGDTGEPGEAEWLDGPDTHRDRWGAEAFLDDIDSSAYGTTPESLRQGLDVVSRADWVWVSPGIPFIVPTFVGLLVALTVGDLLFWGLGAVGILGP